MHTRESPSPTLKKRTNPSDIQSQDVYENGWLRNRSHRRVLLEASHQIPVDKRLELNFSSPDGQASFRAEAIVRWVNKQGERDFFVGLEFQNLLQL